MADCLMIVTNRADWRALFEVLDDADAPIDLTGMTIALSIVDERGTRVDATTANGMVAVTGPGEFLLDVPAATTRQFRGGQAKVGATITNGVQTNQMFLGLVTVLDGVVP